MNAYICIMKKKKAELLGLTRTELEEFIESVGEKRFHGRQIYRWIYNKRVADFDAMTDLSKGLRSILLEKARVSLPREEDVRYSADGFTRKFRFSLHDGCRVESVLMKEKNRITLCVSTQVGCALGCVFCATGSMGFKRNLSSGEIAGQCLSAQDASDKRITNVVLMGMGEPLLNYDNTAGALELFADGDGIAVSSRRITLSTVGIIPGLEKMRRDKLPCKLAVSLNAPDDELRSLLMPINRKYPLKELLPALHRYEKSTRHRITFEYVLLRGINDSPLQAKKLKRLLGGFTAKLNLIVYNPIDLSGLESPAGGERFHHFEPILKDAVEIFAGEASRPSLTVRVRKSQGGDISAACGQLCIKSVGGNSPAA